jgi:predicted AAA+ superfamily ATPase
MPRDPVRLQRFFEAYALNTAGEVTERTLHESAGINRKTAEAYERLLRMLFLVDPVPAWSTNRLKRLVRAPKRYIRDPGLAAAVLRAGIDDVLRDGSLLGRIIDTFVVAQLRAEQLIYDAPPGLFHLRQEGGAREIDIVAELSYRSVVGLEIKASAAPERSDARHLIWLRDELGDAFRAGVVLHTGRHVYRLDDRIVAAPIACLWG